MDIRQIFPFSSPVRIKSVSKLTDKPNAKLNGIISALSECLSFVADEVDRFHKPCLEINHCH